MGIVQLIAALLFTQAGNISKINYNQLKVFTSECVQRCYIGVMDLYMNPNTLTMMDLLEVEIILNICH